MQRAALGHVRHIRRRAGVGPQRPNLASRGLGPQPIQDPCNIQESKKERQREQAQGVSHERLSSKHSEACA